MYFPKYWAKASITGPNREGDTTNVEAWGWSDVSTDDARQRATVRAQASLARIPGPRRKRDEYYQDGNRPLRETILESNTQGAVKSVITRNSFGCEVLNTDCVAFADIDYDPPRVSFFEGLFGGRKKAEEHRAAWETQYMEKLRSWQAVNPSWCFRVYRTAGGLRLLATSNLLQAGSRETDLWLESVGTDPLYRKLCQNQKSFRARLTPKPWRCGYKQPTIRFPYETDDATKKIAKWIEGYGKKCEGFAVCQFLEAMGSSMSLPELKSAIAFHDTRTGAASGLPLA